MFWGPSTLLGPEPDVVLDGGLVSLRPCCRPPSRLTLADGPEKRPARPSDPLDEPLLSLRRPAGPPPVGGRRNLVPDVVIASGGTAIWGRRQGAQRRFSCRGGKLRGVWGLGPPALDGASVPLRGSGLQGTLLRVSSTGLRDRHGHGDRWEQGRGLRAERVLHHTEELVQVLDVCDFVVGGGRWRVGINVEWGVW